VSNKLPVSRLQPVFFGNRFVGTLLKPVQGFEVYNAHTIRIELFERGEAAISRLWTSLANAVST
jgi:hypothetical protein